MEQDLFALVGAIAGFVATIFSIIDKLEDWARRSKKRASAAAGELSDANDGDEEDDEETDSDSPTPKPRNRGRRRRWFTIQWPGWLGPTPGYLIPSELALIGGAGILLNSLGLLLSLRLESILFLDMLGTAFAAILLGPWWGAATALITNGLVNWLLVPQHAPDLLIFPWALVNMTGGFYWGWLSRSDWFRQYLRTGHASVLSHLTFLVAFGAIGAAVMSVPGTLIHGVVSHSTSLTLNAALAEGLDDLMATLHGAVVAQLGGGEALEATTGVVGFLAGWIHTCLLYIPDKVVSVAIALIVIKRAFPIFEEELLLGSEESARPRDNRLAPLSLGLLYTPVFSVLISGDPYLGETYWPLWSAPWLVIFGGYFWLKRHGPNEEALHAARLDRATRYREELGPLRKHPASSFCQRLTVSWLMASALFALFMPVMLDEASKVAFNFFCLVYGSMLGLHVIKISVRQNIALARSIDADLPARHRRRTRAA